MKSLLFVITALILSCSQLPAQVLYSESFDNGNAGWWVWGPDSVSMWELGNPTYGADTGTHSGTACWDINLDTSYFESALAVLFSPRINISGTSGINVVFWMRYNTEEEWDGVQIEMSTDSTNWTSLGNVDDPYGTNWLNSFINFTLPAWTGNSNGWVHCSYNLFPTPDTSIFFRFIFRSDLGMNLDGVSIDDFEVTAMPVNDAGVIGFVSPPVNGFDTIITPQINIKNYGAVTNSQLSVGYSIDNGPVISESPVIPIDALDTASYTFNAQCHVSYGIHTIKAWAQFNNDEDAMNDTSVIAFTVMPPVSIPYATDFTSADGWIAETLTPGSSWEFGTPSYGITSDAHSGTTCWDVDLNSAYDNKSNTVLYGPCFNITGLTDLQIGFWIKYLTNHDDGVHVDYAFDGGVWSLLGHDGNDTNAVHWYGMLFTPGNDDLWTGNSFGWRYAGYNLNFSNHDVVQFRFVFNSDNKDAADGFSMDDFSVTAIPLIDAATTGIDNGGAWNMQHNTPFNPQVFVKNHGLQSLVIDTVAWRIDNGPVVYETTSIALNPSQTETYNILTPVTSTDGWHTLYVWSHTPGDTVLQDDTTQFDFLYYHIPTAPYFNTFDSTDVGWTTFSGGANHWELGEPTYGATNSAHSSNSCWDINLDTAYYTSGNSNLTSPKIVISGSNEIGLSFWLNYNTEFETDGLTLLYRTDNGQYTPLGSVNDVNGTNWFNSTIAVTNRPGWSGNSGGWVNSTFYTTAFTGEDTIQFQFNFAPHGGVGDGVSLDDFGITIITGVDHVKSSSTLNCFPNPAADVITITSKDKLVAGSLMMINDPAGRNVKQVVINDTHQLSINVSDLSPGIYTAVIHSAVTTVRSRFVKN